MKICHLTSVHHRTDRRIFHKMCTSLAKAGHDVTLVVADGKQDEIRNDVKIINVEKVFTNRLKRFFISTKKVYQKGLELNADIYHLHDPELLPYGLKLKKKGKKVIFDMHENIPADISEKEYIPVFVRRILSVLYEKYEKYSTKQLDGVVSTTQGINDRLAHYNKNIRLITNFPEIIENIEKITTTENIICFAGAIVPNYRHKEIIQAIESIDNVKYILAGPSDNNYLNELKKLKGWNKVEYLGAISYDEVLKIYKKATIGVAIHVYNGVLDGTRGCLSVVKPFEFMLWEIPLICTDFLLWKEIIEKQEQCGICVNPYDSQAISDSIKYLINHPEIAIQMGKRGRQAVINKYNWSSQEKILFELYQSIIKS